MLTKVRWFPVKTIRKVIKENMSSVPQIEKPYKPFKILETSGSKL